MIGRSGIRTTSNPSRRRGSLVALRWLERSFLLLVIGILILVFWRLSPGWLNSQTFPFLIAQNAPLEVLTVAMTFSMISANIDLSPGSMLSLAAMVMGLVYERTGSLWWGMVVSLGLTLLVGAVSGFIVGRLQISAIIVTLATYIWAAGLATGINSANAIPMKGALLNFLNRGIDGWTWTIVVVFVFFALGHFLLAKTKFGYYSRAIGGNSEFARDEAASRSAGKSYISSSSWVSPFGWVPSCRWLSWERPSLPRGRASNSTLSSPLSSAAPVSPAVRAAYCAAAWGLFFSPS